MKSMKTVLLTGATGFLGSHMLELLLQSGYNVIVTKRSTSDVWRIEHLLSKVQSYDIDTDSIETVFASNKIDAVIHLATLYRKFNNGKEVAEMVSSNITFPIELLEVGLRHGLKAFINTGTFFEYDCSHLPVDESSSLSAFNLYAKTKTAFESMLQTYSDKLLINTFRLFSPYGEKDNQKLIPLIINRALSGNKLELSEGFQKLDFIYAKDVVAAYLAAIKRFEISDVKNEYQIFNLGSGITLSVRDVLSVVEQSAGVKIDVTWGEKSAADIPVAYANISKAKAVLGWEPHYSIQQGICNTLSYYKENSDDYK